MKLGRNYIIHKDPHLHIGYRDLLMQLKLNLDPRMYLILEIIIRTVYFNLTQITKDATCCAYEGRLGKKIIQL